MNKKIGLQTVCLDSKPVILEAFSSVGKKEGEGPLREYFDKIHQDEFLNKQTRYTVLSKINENSSELLLSNKDEAIERFEYYSSLEK